MTNENSTDMYGTDAGTAVRLLERYVREDLQEPQAEVAGLELVDGHWQGNVAGSARGIRVVFLREHAGQLAPGHMTEDYPPEV